MSEGFLARWSRRKQAASQGETLAEAPVPPVAEEATPSSPSAEAPVASPIGTAPDAEAGEAFDPTSLPPIESLTAESDFSLFLRKGVPESLRRAALRRAWSLDPNIRDFIGPADYAWDFNAPDGVPGFSPSLGGDVAKLLAQAIGLERDAEAAATADAATAAAAPDPPAPAEAQDAQAERAPETAREPAAPPAIAAASPATHDATPLLAAPRRHGSATPV